MMLTLKAGISMDNKTVKNKCLATQGISSKAFTFIEVIAALAIISISVLSLLKLHLTSIKVTETAEITSQAVFLANEKIEELLAWGYPQKGIDYGRVERNNLTWNWKTEVTDLQLPRLNEADIAGLRKITVNVSWAQAAGRKNLQMSTYVADRRLGEQ